MSNNELQALLDEGRADRKAAAKSLKLTLGVIVFLNVFAFIYMSWIRSSLGELDASELTRIASTEIQASIPKWEQELGDRIIAEAPAITEKARIAMLEAPRKFRMKIEQNVQDRIRDNIHEFESAMDARLEGLTEQRIEELRILYPEGTDKDRLDQFLADAMKNYKENVRSSLEAIYGDFAVEAERLDDYMLLLQTSERLSDEEKLHRGIFQAWVVLVEKHKADQHLR
ncbi:MAG: hypothetical protein ACYTDX_03025 [Planctomycetota bacterium]|jgi:hypothetical protein